MIEIRPADLAEAEELTRLAIRSKAFWGYSEQFMRDCAAELAVTPQLLSSDDHQCFVAANDNTILGFYTLARLQTVGCFELEALFVTPDSIGQGVGKQLLAHAKVRCQKLGGKTLSIQGDPNAAEFYLSQGCVLVGERESGSIHGRMLPVYEIDLTEC